MEYCAGRFQPLCDEVSLVPFPSDFVHDPEFSDPIPGVSYDGRASLRAALGGGGAAPSGRLGGGRGGGPRSLIINAHVDVVPPSEGHVDPFNPVVRDGALYGRGACDDKGQIAVLFEALKLMRERGVRPAGRLIMHLVAEEENGGNGALALVRTEERADGAIDMEPTDLAVANVSRSSVWFRVRTHGQPGHAGDSARRRNALLGSVAAIRAIERCHAALRERSQGIAPFDGIESSMPLIFGKLNAGSWPASVPGDATLMGVFAFLPNTDREQVMSEFRECIAREAGIEDAEVSFPFRHQCHVTPPEAPIVREALRAVSAAGIEPRTAGFPSSSDAWLYNNLLGVPTIIFGAGKLSDAHTRSERIALDDIDRGARALERFISAWCGEARA